MSSSQRLDVGGSSNAFPLGCGTRLCFVRENCRLSLWEMEAEYLLLLGCCLVGYFTDFWMRAVQNAGTKAFSVQLDLCCFVLKSLGCLSLMACGTNCTALQLGQAGRLLLWPQDEGKLIVWCVRRGEVRKN